MEFESPYSMARDAVVGSYRPRIKEIRILVEIPNCTPPLKFVRSYGSVENEYGKLRVPAFQFSQFQPQRCHISGVTD